MSPCPECSNPPEKPHKLDCGAVKREQKMERLLEIAREMTHAEIRPIAEVYIDAAIEKLELEAKCINVNRAECLSQAIARLKEAKFWIEEAGR